MFGIGLIFPFLDSPPGKGCPFPFGVDMGKKRKGAGAKKQDMRKALEVISKGVENMITVNHLEEERYIPTMFTSYNRATGIGGHPIRKMTTIHGKNSTGKTGLALGLAESNRMLGHIPVIYECEYAEESRWYNRLLMGEGTLFKHPATLDELFADIFTNLNNLADGKKKGILHPNIGICFVIDTLTQLIPQEMLTTLLTKGFKKSYPLQAMWVSTWTKAIVPLAYRANCSFVIVLQERVNVGATKFQKQRKVTLGEALLYDVSVRVECYRSEAIKRKKEGESIILGSRFDYKLAKNKVDGWTDAEGSFFTSTGKGDTPKGFDPVREAIHEARLRGLLKSRKNDVVLSVPVDARGAKTEMKFKGGMEDVRERLQDDPDRLQKFVDVLNINSRLGT